MALQMVGPKDPRAYNIERDMLWGLPRLIQRALKQLGVTSDEGMIDVMKAHGIAPPPGDIEQTLSQVVREMLDAIIDALRAAEPGETSAKLWEKVYASGDPTYVALRTLISVLLVKGIVCELPLWAASVKPKHVNDPLPDRAEIEAAANEFLGRLRP